MARRGNPDNLRAAARRKRERAVERAEHAINALVRDGEAVNFRSVARLAECSPEFLYKSAALRSRIEQLRTAPRRRAPAEPDAASTSAVVRALTDQLIEEKRRRREEIAALESALAAAQGELLQLRRRQTSHAASTHDR